jgi:hypothetical protein
MALQIRRGPTADRVLKIFADGEIIYDTDLQEVFIGDGTTLGGRTVSTYSDGQSQDAAASIFTHGDHSNISFTYDSVLKKIIAVVGTDETYNDLVEDLTPELGGNLSLNGKDVTLANGTVIINGTTGSITANVTGNLTGNASTVTNGVYTTSTLNIGQTSIPLNRVSDIQTLTGVSITGNAATVTNGIYNTGDQTISGTLTATAFEGDVYGSVYGSDGIALLVNAATDSINAASVATVDLTVSGTLLVNGTTTTINSTTLEIADKNITLAKGATDALAADGAGISIDGANATILYVQSTDRIVINKAVSSSSGFVGNVTGNVTGNVIGNVTGNADTVTNGVYTSGDQTIDGIKTFSSGIVGNVIGDIDTNNISSISGSINVTSPILSTSTIEATQVSSSTMFVDNINVYNSGVSSILTITAGVVDISTSEVVARTISTSEDIVSTNIIATNNGAILVGEFVSETFTSSVELNSTASKIDSPLVLNGIVTLPKFATLPASPVNGMIFYNTTANKFQGYQNGVWINLDGTT